MEGENDLYAPEKTYKVVELKKFGGELSISERNFRQLKNGEVLVKVMCTTMHPADLAFLNGTYGSMKPDLPLVPGFEGSGLIVKVGDGVEEKLVGKRCGLTVNSSKPGKLEGLWAQYHYTTVPHLLIFDEDISYDIICFAIGNPLTAVGFLDTIRKKNVTSVGQNGSSSSFGRIFIKLCAKEGIKTVNIVRKQEYVDNLKSIGADYVISTSDPSWEKEFEKIAKELNVSNFFDCVGGDITGKCLRLLPDDSTLYHFGNLELKRLGSIDTSDFIFRGKVIRGWWLLQWMLSLTPEESDYWRNYIIKELQKGSDIFKTTVSKSFPLEEFEKGIEYYLTNMSEGKIIIRPNNS